MIGRAPTGGVRSFHRIAENDVVLDLRDVVVSYAARGGRRAPAPHAVDGVTFSVRSGESVGLVGESGCGKSSLGRSIVGLAPLTSGSISVGERAAGDERGRTRRRLSRSAQIVFQDPYSSMDPRQSVGAYVAEPMRVHGLVAKRERARAVGDLLDRVGLGASFASRYPHELSGGQRQRVCVARSLAIAPTLLVCDEPTSALDVSIQAQVVELFRELQSSEGLTYLFITHDLALLPQIATTVVVMYLGQIVERGPVHDVLHRPRHPYSISLVGATPTLGRRSAERPPTMLRGDAVAAGSGGCRFRNRCWAYPTLDAGARARCDADVPQAAVDAVHSVACHHAESVAVRSMVRT